MGKITVRGQTTNFRKLCPFIKTPFDDCYCTKLTSMDVEKTVYFCGENFEKCKIYGKRGGIKECIHVKKAIKVASL